MKQITIWRRDSSSGLFALVDDYNFAWLNKFVWLLHKNGLNTIYAKTYLGSKKYIDMHKLILPSPSVDLTPDHINGNGLDNQEHNLRLATKSQNFANTNKRNSNCSSKYKGVCWDKNRNSWKVEICCKGVRQHIGYYSTEAEAALAYNKVAFDYFGEFIKLNEVK